MGGTGDSPVPVGDTPTGTVGRKRTLCSVTRLGRSLPFRPAGRRTAQASGPCYPIFQRRAPFWVAPSSPCSFQKTDKVRVHDALHVRRRVAAGGEQSRNLRQVRNGIQVRRCLLAAERAV